jgi:deferrochelatase/peroxidase EfeB
MEVSNLSKDPYKRLRKAIKHANKKGKPITIHLNRGESGENFEGVIKEVSSTYFYIQQQLESNELSDLESINFSEVEYIEYS